MKGTDSPKDCERYVSLTFLVKTNCSKSRTACPIVKYFYINNVKRCFFERKMVEESNNCLNFAVDFRILFSELSIKKYKISEN